MSTKIKATFLGIAAMGIVFAMCTFVSCNNRIDTPFDTKHIAEFHAMTSPMEQVCLKPDRLALYVDYSNCIAGGLSSPFYQKMVSPLTAATKEYWSIKGEAIALESGDVYNLLNNVMEINYAALDKAIAQMAERDCESVLLTDGELFTQTAAKNNPNNPYMHAAFKEWLLKGGDIHIIAEPYQEQYGSHVFNKKRFYIVFTDDRVQGNIYDRIAECVDFTLFPDVDEFHLSGNYPWIVPANGAQSVVNENTGAGITAAGWYEFQDWSVDWKNITALILGGVDDEGNPLPNGEKLIGGLQINRNAFGCYRISDIDVRVSNINAEYNCLYNQLEAGESVGDSIKASPRIENFIVYDTMEFKKHGVVDLYFDAANFAPDPNTDLNGKPFNYFKIEIAVGNLENILGNSIDIFNFDSIVNQGQTNESISESLKNCVFDPELTNRLKGTVLYTIYVKSDKY